MSVWKVLSIRNHEPDVWDHLSRYEQSWERKSYMNGILINFIASFCGNAGNGGLVVVMLKFGRKIWNFGI